MAVVTAKVVLEHKKGLEILSLRSPSPGGEAQVSVLQQGAKPWGGIPSKPCRDMESGNGLGL